MIPVTGAEINRNEVSALAVLALINYRNGVLALLSEKNGSLLSFFLFLFYGSSRIFINRIMNLRHVNCQRFDNPSSSL